MNQETKINRSYNRRVKRGDVVTLAEEISGYDSDTGARPVAPKGARVTVTDESNAGFRGIEFSFAYNGVRDFHGISTGSIK